MRLASHGDGRRSVTLYVPISTDVGIIRGRDAIYVRQFQINEDHNFTVRGELNGALCSSAPSADFFGFRCVFHGVVGFRMDALDHSDASAYRSSFDEGTESEWLNTIRSRDPSQDFPGYREFRLVTYDDVFTLICHRYDLTVDR